MARVSLAGFRDPIRRPRHVVWTAVALIALIVVMIPVLGITSSRWFCGNGCHNVQDDSISAYQRSPHSEIACYSCHMPVNANPVVFMLHKAENLGELYLVATGSYHLPLNGDNEVAFTMKPTQCTQCHDENKRPVTPSTGLKINHDVHASKGVYCTICHNRTAHVENFDLKLADPSSSQPNRKHENFMKMAACFRCHSQDYGEAKKPSGDCRTCHTSGFQLRPPSHLQPGFFPKGHGKLAVAEESRTLRVSRISWLNGPAAQTTAGAGEAAGSSESTSQETLGESLVKVESINLCSTCHRKRFCIDCHGGVAMPHAADWKDTHSKLGKQVPKACAKCHGATGEGCSSCHHGIQINFAYNPAVPWRKQHPTAVVASGAAGCLANCHNPTFCSNCHANGGVPPR